MSQFKEKYLAWILCAITMIGCLWWRYSANKPYFIPDDPRCILTTIITVNSIAIGFIATAKSVLLSLRGTRPGRNLDKRGKYGDCMAYFMSCIKSLLWFTAVCSVGLFIPGAAKTGLIADLFCATWLSVGVFSMVRLIQTILIYEAFTKELSKPDQSPAQETSSLAPKV